MVGSLSVRVDRTRTDGARARALITRPGREGGPPRVLVLSQRGLHFLGGLERAGEEPAGVSVGPPIELNARRGGLLVPFELDEDDAFWRAVCDPTTGLIYISTRSTILQLDLDASHTVTLLAGVHGEEGSLDGPGADARVDQPFCMLADGRGGLLIKDCGSDRVRRVALPPPGSPPGALAPAVTTLPHVYEDNVWAVALDFAQPQQPRLIVATNTAIYRHETLPYDTSPGQPGTAPAAAGTAADAAAVPAAAAAPPADAPPQPPQPPQPSAPLLLVGREDDDARADGVSYDARGGGGAAAAGGSARFSCITCMVADASGRLFIAESEPDEDGEPHLRVLSPCGLVTTLAARLELRGSEFGLAILPHGWLALHAWNGDRIQLLRLGVAPSLPPPRSASPGGAAGGADGLGALEGPEAAGGALGPGRPGLAGLAADLGLLLEEPGPTSDLVVVVGGRTFAVHRALLGARCDYFRRFFSGGFADSGRGEVSLPDADADAFAQLLRFIYSGTMDFPQHLLRPVAELADRLLLPAASRRAQQLLLAATGPGRVVEDLLWAEAHSFTGLLAGLKAYYLDNAHRVLEEAPDSLEALMLRSPRLHLDLYAAGIKRARRS